MVIPAAYARAYRQQRSWDSLFIGYFGDGALRSGAAKSRRQEEGKTPSVTRA